VLDRVRAETAVMPNAAMQVAADQGALTELIVLADDVAQRERKAAEGDDALFDG
jgi:hypothetical protein